jgi:hypothetical protein
MACAALSWAECDARKNPRVWCLRGRSGELSPIPCVSGTVAHTNPLCLRAMRWLPTTSSLPPTKPTHRRAHPWTHLALGLRQHSVPDRRHGCNCCLLGQTIFPIAPRRLLADQSVTPFPLPHSRLLTPTPTKLHQHTSIHCFDPHPQAGQRHAQARIHFSCSCGTFFHSTLPSSNSAPPPAPPTHTPSTHSPHNHSMHTDCIMHSTPTHTRHRGCGGRCDRACVRWLHERPGRHRPSPSLRPSGLAEHERKATGREPLRL